MKTIAYLEGIDPEFLPKLVCKGYRALPIGNKVDGRGKYIAFISVADEIDLIVGYFHKVSPLLKITDSLKDLLTPGIIHNIPILLLAFQEVKSEVKKILAEVMDNPSIKIIDSKHLMEEALKILNR
ncbi:hypothetical protein AYK25_01610 [Thermoplasmatales archaeon SM1-50]|nr:MAG: hypothetical protein AYK25_01610 [Thermoplasmatales archaeon SM1-50]